MTKKDNKESNYVGEAELIVNDEALAMNNQEET